MTDIVEVFRTTSWLFLGGVFILGLIVGSFLNVVIHRVPLMLQRQWRSECRELLELEKSTSADANETARFNLVVPGSHCPHCGHKIRAYENIPLLSYLVLGGKCSACGGRISLRYPAVELLSGLLALAVAWQFGFTVQTLSALIFTWTLIALSGIDIDHQLLPDNITLPLLWLGLLLSLGAVFVELREAVIGVAAGYLSLWLVYHAFRLLTGKEGMGYGDFKLFAAIGAWLGWAALPLVILLSSLVGAAVGLSLILLRGRDRSVPIPFGPYLAAAGWIAMLWGDRIVGTYLDYTGGARPPF
jgi:leader peptidase (prepilin peptidase)/N-methyltransferase